ncbi:hypothetical protein JW988_04510 [Candidatus Bathyarchaeota archaeon]|nr:hypothetical protein [Candidatus Bathyarchaeota archaeon]
MFEFLVLIAASATLVAAFAYIRSMFKGQTKPNRVTWLMWTIAPFTAAFAAFSSGATWAAVPVLMSGLSPFLILLASFLNKRAYWKLSAFDYACGVLSALALVFWYVTENPNVAIVFAIFSDALAATPTLRKAWHNPQTEFRWPFLVGVFSPMTSFLVAPAWTFSEIAFPAYLIAINILLVFSMSNRKQKRTAA